MTQATQEQITAAQRPLALASLSDAQRDYQTSERNLQVKVLTARKFGASWAEVGEALGVTRQAAHQRFGHLDVHVAS